MRNKIVNVEICKMFLFHHASSFTFTFVLLIFFLPIFEISVMPFKNVFIYSIIQRSETNFSCEAFAIGEIKRISI